MYSVLEQLHLRVTNRTPTAAVIINTHATPRNISDSTESFQEPFFIRASTKYVKQNCVHL